ncbi:hypothetical protein ZEAMMB73_Zm00001d011168 [Zea mays]|nr:hypothetical protein ZEAMMB73_Zm00001d011168 [Zea mays]
MSLPFFG